MVNPDRMLYLASKQNQQSRQANHMKTNDLLFVIALIISQTILSSASAEVSQEVLDSISTPDRVQTSIGELAFLDGAPMPDTADTRRCMEMHGVT